MSDLKAFRPIPPIKRGETVLLDYDDVKRINATFEEYVRKLNRTDQLPRIDGLDEAIANCEKYGYAVSMGELKIALQAAKAYAERMG